MKKEVRKKHKHFDTIFNSIQPLPLQITKAISYTHKNQRPQVDCFATNLSTYYRADQDVISDTIGYSYDRTTSYPTDSVVFQGSKFRVDINICTADLKDPTTLLN